MDMQKRHPAVSILIAVYHPNFRWLKQLLESIKKQTFQDYEVLIMDDGSGPDSFGCLSMVLQQVFGSCRNIKLKQSIKNEGSNKTFEKLVRCAAGDYIAFCDQDDIWEAEKLQQLVDAVTRNHAVLVYSDMSVIDQDGVMLYPSLRGMRKRLKFVSGRNQTARYLIENCTAACSMLVRRKIVLQTLPFYMGVYCDQWICAMAAAAGSIVFVDAPLVKYRRHGKNQTGMLGRIGNWQEYYEQRILPAYGLVEELKKRGVHYKYESAAEAFVKARMEKDILGIWKYRRLCIKYAYFDICMICMPNALSQKLLHWLHCTNNGVPGWEERNL